MINTIPVMAGFVTVGFMAGRAILAVKCHFGALVRSDRPEFDLPGS
jgi:hypothetical protein